MNLKTRNDNRRYSLQLLKEVLIVPIYFAKSVPHKAKETNSTEKNDSAQRRDTIQAGKKKLIRIARKSE
ncbi:9647_t:CDS:1, partial [Gigaspora rosea]